GVTLDGPTIEQGAEDVGNIFELDLFAIDGGEAITASATPEKEVVGRLRASHYADFGQCRSCAAVRAPGHAQLQWSTSERATRQRFFKTTHELGQTALCFGERLTTRRQRRAREGVTFDVAELSVQSHAMGGEDRGNSLAVVLADAAHNEILLWS